MNRTRRLYQQLKWLFGQTLTAALLFQASLIPIALVLAWLLELRPWAQMEASLSVLLLSLPATAAVFAAWLLLAPFRFEWAKALEADVQRLLGVLFRRRFPGAVLLVSVLAGVGEELLFRGVIQAGLVDWLGVEAGILLAAIVFGLAHCISLAYFLMACVMGIYLGLLYHWSGNLLLPILVHALYDWIAIHIYLRRTPPAPDPEDGQAAGD